MAVEGWDVDDEGNLRIGPLIGYDIATQRMLGLVRLRYALSEIEFETGGRPVQMHMTPVQARALGQALLRMADTIDAQYLGTKQ